MMSGPPPIDPAHTLAWMVPPPALTVIVPPLLAANVGHEPITVGRCVGSVPYESATTVPPDEPASLPELEPVFVPELLPPLEEGPDELPPDDAPLSSPLLPLLLSPELEPLSEPPSSPPEPEPPLLVDEPPFESSPVVPSPPAAQPWPNETEASSAIDAQTDAEPRKRGKLRTMDPPGPRALAATVFEPQSSRLTSGAQRRL
jgi:hypothetical protein